MCTRDLFYLPTDDGLSMNPRNVFENKKHWRFYSIISIMAIKYFE